MLNVDNVNR